MATFSRHSDLLAPYQNGQWFVVNLKPRGAQISLIENRDRLVGQRMLKTKVMREAGLRTAPLPPPVTKSPAQATSEIRSTYQVLTQ